jgi:hypothetical protein
LQNEITEEDERALEMFMSVSESKKMTLGDIIMEKIREKEALLAGQTTLGTFSSSSKDLCLLSHL